MYICTYVPPGTILRMSHLRIRDDISSFTIFTKPEKKIFVTKDMPKHSLFFLPHSANMDYKKKNLKKEFVVERDWIDSKEKVAGETLWIKPHWQPKTATKAFEMALTEPFWAVRRVNRSDAREEEGNMALVYVHSRGHVVTCFTGDKMMRSDVDFVVPCLTNIQDIPDGGELIWVADFVTKKRKLTPLQFVAKKVKNDTEVCSEK